MGARRVQRPREFGIFRSDIIHGFFRLPMLCVPLPEPPRVLSQPEKASEARMAKLSVASVHLSFVFMFFVFILLCL